MLRVVGEAQHHVESGHGDTGRLHAQSTIGSERHAEALGRDLHRIDDGQVDPIDDRRVPRHRRGCPVAGGEQQRSEPPARSAEGHGARWSCTLEGRGEPPCEPSRADLARSTSLTNGPGIQRGVSQWER